MAKRPLPKSPGVPAPPAGDTPAATKVTRARRTKASATVAPPIDSATDNPSTIASEMPAPDQILPGTPDFAAIGGTGSPGEPFPSDDEIREAAYHRFLSRGGTEGSELDDWLAAERELRRK